MNEFGFFLFLTSFFKPLFIYSKFRTSRKCKDQFINREAKAQRVEFTSSRPFDLFITQ